MFVFALGMFIVFGLVGIIATVVDTESAKTAWHDRNKDL